MSKGETYWINPSSGEFEPFHRYKSDVDAPSVITDEIDATIHNGTGKVFTSKRKMDSASKEAGLITRSASELPNINFRSQRKHMSDEGKIRETAERAWHAVDNGMAPLTEKERYLCKQENERLKRGD